MHTSACILLAALCAESVIGSYYHGPTAVPRVLKSGHLADTHEVAAAKGAHLDALSSQSNYGHGSVSGLYGYEGDHSGSYGYAGDHSGSYGYGGDHSGSYGYGGEYGHDVKYHGPTAIPHVLKNGHIADTHEVSAAKAAHYAAVSKAKAYGGYGYAGDYGYGGDHGYGGGYGYGQAGHGGSYGHSYGHGNYLRYRGPTAIPHVLKDGHIADTHEVAAAKAEHHSAVAVAKSHGGYGYGNGYSHGYSGHY